MILRRLVLLPILLFLSVPALAESLDVSARPIPTFGGIPTGGQVGNLAFRGGLELSSSHRDFGGLSGLTFLDAGERFVAVTDQGRFLSGRLVYEAGAPSAIVGAEIAPIRNSSGTILPNAFSRDAETVETVFRDGRPAAVRVGFEGLERIADFVLVEDRPGGAATEVAIPGWLSALRTNQSIESVCIAPPASPVAGSTLIITEGHEREPGAYAATLLGVRDRGDLGLAIAGDGFNPTDCAFLPDGDLLVLERAMRFLSFYVQIRRIPAHAVAAGTVMDGEVILSAGGAEVDNYEGLAVHATPDGETRITLLSDNNFHFMQRTLLLQFSLD